MNDWTRITFNDLNKSQQRGARRLINQINESAERNQRYGPAIAVEINRWEHLVSITVRQELPQLGEGNLLRYLTEADYFHAFIGRRGAVNAVTYPKSFKQFKGRRVFGINVK